MKNKFLILILVILTSILTYSQSGFVSVRGKNIVDTAGKKLILKGIGIGNWLVPEGYMFKFKKTSSPGLIDKTLRELIGPAETNKFWKKFRENYITRNDIQFLKQAGFNSIRVPFNFRLFASEDNPEIFLEEGFVQLDKIISFCEEADLYVILDMHCAPGGQTGDNIDDSFGYPFLFLDKESQLLTINIWKRIAERYKDKTIITGYDLLNEPIAHYFDIDNLNPKLELFFKELVNEIRKTDKNHIVFIGGAQWNSNFDVFGPPFDSLSVYTFHKYWTEPTLEVIQSYIDYRDRYNVPVWMGESGENTNDWIYTFRNVLEENEIGWCFWPYKKLDSDRGVVSIDTPDGWEKIQEYAEGDRSTYSSIRESRPSREEVLNILSQYLENCKFENCIINKEYLNALGF
ncbi:MAG: glycoside hydrolase family 5 protein [Ignavibacteriales bacterium]|nr:MAG: glycoside hydrolase family 5 protein [Ignavibacteriales bacterium]